MAFIKKERIKDQMVRTTARLWGIQENEIETNFDPLIMLIIEACAAELEKLGYELGASHARLVDKLATLVLPDAMIGAQPSAAIMRTKPVEPLAMLTEETKFFTAQRVRTTTGFKNEDVFFTPVGNFPVLNADLAFVLIGQRLYRVNAEGQKELLSGADSDGTANVGSIWLAVSPDKALQTLKGLSMYFDMRSHSDATTFYKSLENATAKIGGESINLQKGYFNQRQFEPDLHQLLESGDDYTGKTARHIAGVYQRHFVHIADDVDLSTEQVTQMPTAWEVLPLAQAVRQQLTALPLIYINIELGRVFHQEVLDALSFSINSFPVINRKLNILNYRTDPWINIVPVQMTGYFLDIHSINSISGGGYKFRVAGNSRQIEAGEAIVRSTGVGKAGSREVREIIGSLMESIRDESAFFSEINNDFIQTRLKEISQILARLEDQVDRSFDMQNGHHYIMLRSKNPGEQLVIQYWTTNGEEANGIKVGTILTPFNHTLVAAKNTVLLTNAFGGKATLSDAEKRTALRRQLLSKGKIITIDDVKLLCTQIFHDKLKQVTVKKGVRIDNGVQQGFSTTIDVHLSLKNDAFDAASGELEYLIGELEFVLQENASPVYPYRVVASRD